MVAPLALRVAFKSSLLCRSFALAAVLICASLSISHAQTDTNIYRLDLRGHGCLKDVFDAGLRPKNESVGATLRCMVEDKIITFELGNHAVTIPSESCYLKIRGTNQAIDEIMAESIPLTLAEVRAWMSPVCRNFGKPQNELDQFLEKVRKGYRRFGWLSDEDNEGFGMGTARPPLESDLASLGVWLKHYGASTNHPVRIQVAVYWERPHRYSRFPDPPLQAPKEYQQFSMEPDEKSPPYTATWIRKGWPAPVEVQRDYGPAGVQRLRDEYMARKGLTNPPTPFSPPLPSPTN